jgi:arabinan endo-1,5-alpha-L-arabinosidase
VATDKIPGKYKLLVHNYRLDHTAKALATPVDVVLNADGTVTGNEYSGKWSVREGTSYVTLNLGAEYKGVMVVQTLEPKNEQTPCFTALNSATGVTVWGYKYAEN